MSESFNHHLREILLTAIGAARYGVPLEPSIRSAVIEGDRQLTLGSLKLDSLGWMEFCISIELQSGQELTPFDIERISFVFEIEDWLRERIG